MSDWYDDWQSADHARAFDGRAALGRRELERWYDGFNDVGLLAERVTSAHDGTLVEVGCATGDFYRYLRRRYPRLQYYGVDISGPAIARAREKYPAARFVRYDTGQRFADVLENLGLPKRADVVYAKDVVHHQVEPLGFVSSLLACAADTLIVRCRTRDVGPTEWNPDRSCQYHYGGWMPYIVINVDDLLDHLRREAPTAEIVVRRHHTVLGGRHGRYVPKDCYVPATGTAETAVGVYLRTAAPGRVDIADRPEQLPRRSLTGALRRRVLGHLRGRSADRDGQER